MAARQKPEFGIISTEVAFAAALAELSQEKAIVLDVHQEWCGPTSAIMSYLNQLWVDVENCNSKIALFTLALDGENTAGLQKAVQKIIDPEVKLANQGCRPLFVVLRHGQCVGTVDGVDAPKLNMFLMSNIPKAAKKEK